MLADHSSKGQRYFSTLSAPLQCSKMCLLQPAGIAGRRLISTACSCVSPLCGLTSSTIAWSQLQGTDSQHPDQRCFMQTLPCKSSFFLDIGTYELESSRSARTLQVPCCLSPAFASSAYLPGNVAMHTAVHFQPNGLVSQIKFRSCHTCILRKRPRSPKAKISRYGTGSSKPCCIFGECPVASFVCEGRVLPARMGPSSTPHHSESKNQSLLVVTGPSNMLRLMQTSTRKANGCLK